MNNEVRPPNPGLTVAVFGATGNLGGHYAQQALAAGHTLRALAQTVTKLAIPATPT